MYHTVHDCVISHIIHQASTIIQQKQKYSQFHCFPLAVLWFEHTTRPWSGSLLLSVFVLMRSPLGYHARVCDLVSQIISSYSTSLQHSPHSKNALRILLKLPLRLTLTPLSLCSAHLSRPAHRTALLSSPHPGSSLFFFSHQCRSSATTTRPSLWLAVESSRRLRCR